MKVDFSSLQIEILSAFSVSDVISKSSFQHLNGIECSTKYEIMSKMDLIHCNARLL